MKAQILVATSLVTLFSAVGFAAPTNTCQAKAVAAATQEMKTQLGVSDAQIGFVRQTPWVVTFEVISQSAISNTNPAGQIDVLVGIKNVTADDCEVGGVSLDVYSTNG